MPQFLLPLEFERRQHSVPRVLALRVVEHLDLVEHVPPGFLAGPVGATPDPLALEQVEEALGNGVIMAIAAPAHGMLEVVGFQKSGPVHDGELASLIGVDQHLGVRLPAPRGHEQSLKHDVGRLARLHGPSDHTA